MIKKTIAILAAFSIAFAFAACGKLEKEEATTTKPAASNPLGEMPDLNETQLFVQDAEGNTVPVVTQVDENGNIYYEYTDSEGNSVTKTDTENLVGVTKFSKEEQEQIEEIYKDFQENPDAIYEQGSTEGLKLYDGVIPESMFVKADVKLNADGKPDRGDTAELEKIFESNNFTFKVNVRSTVDGSTMETPMSWIKSGNNMLIEVVAPFDETGKAIKGSILYKDGKCYMIMPSMKVYYEVPQDMANEMFNPEMFDEALESTEVADDNVYKASYNVTISGKTYSCDVFETKDGKTTNKKYYDAEGNIVRTEMISGEDVNIWEIIELSNKADSSNFVIPSGLINVSAFLEM